MNIRHPLCINEDKWYIRDHKHTLITVRLTTEVRKLTNAVQVKNLHIYRSFPLGTWYHFYKPIYSFQKSEATKKARAAE